MRRVLPALTALALVAPLPFVATGAASGAEPGLPAAPAVAGATKKVDNRVHPLAASRNALRQQAIDELLDGEAELSGRGRSRTIHRADGIEVDYPVTQRAKLLTFLVEFGESDPDDLASPDFPAEGPLRGEIPEPDRDLDNATYWKPVFDRKHYLDMLFDGLPEQGGESMRDLYQEMSSGRFDLSGDVSDWVQLPEAEAFYSDAGGYENQPEMTAFIGDTANAWAEAQLADSDPEDVRTYLAEYDQWDRYDLDGDGNYNEPDGYIDHFQAVHAGVGEEAGGAPWTIWSHRWAANLAGYGEDGPSCPEAMEATDPDQDCRIGGVPIGDTGFYIFDYTTEPENGGLGVFAHEFAHDLGLPDYYDTENTDGDNSNGYWTLMDSGSWLGHGDGATGNSAGHMGPTEKLFLGWYGAETPDGFDDLAVVDGLAAQPQEIVLGPSYHASTVGKQAVHLTLPDGEALTDGPLGGSYLYSGTRDATAVTATSPAVTVPEGGELQARIAYQIEEHYDYAYLQASTDGTSWANLETSVSSPLNPTGANLGHGITGTSTGGTWVDVTADLSAFEGQQVTLRWLYVTDPNTHGAGLLVDSLTLGSYSTAFDSADGWTLAGFHAVQGGEYEFEFPQSYTAENRSFDGYDATLATGPYSFNYGGSAPNKVDHYSYEDGLLIYYSNGAYGDNNTMDHPGYGANLPVDARPGLVTWTGTGGPVPANGRLQAFDATFDVDDNSAIAMTREVPGGSQSVSVPARPAIPVFEDSDPDTYFDAGADGMYSTKVSGLGAMIQVVSSDETTGRMVVKVGKRFVAPTSKPEVDGEPAYDEILRATPPTWFQDDVDTTVSWLRDGKPIDDADALTYQVADADVGHTLSVRFTGALAGYTTTVVESAGVAVTPHAAPAPSAALAIGGTPRVDAELVAQGATWPVPGASTFTWWVGETQVGTGTTYRAAPGDVGKQVTLKETFRAPGHAEATTTATSAAIAAGPAATATRAPQILGSAQVGATLTVAGADWSRAGTSSFAWTIGGRSAGTGTSYVVRVGDVGRIVTVTETRTSPGYQPGAASASTATVAKAPVTLRLKVAKPKRNKPVSLTVRAGSPDLRVTGKVKVTYAGDNVGTYNLRAGKVSLKLPKQAKGTYTLKVTYLSTLRFASATKTAQVRVR